MDNENNTTGWPLDMHQLKWALRHGQIIDGMENMVLTSQPADPIGNNMDNRTKKDSAAENISLHNMVVEEKIDQLGQSLNREIVSLKGEFAIVAQGTAVEEKVDELGQTLNQEILSLKSELANVAQGTAVEQQIEQLAQSLNQEILSLRNEFAIFVQTQLNQEKAWKTAEIEWKNVVADRETKLQADMRQMQHNILAKIEEHFQYVDEERQHNDNMLRQEVSLLTSQLAELQQSQDAKGQVLTNDWQKKLEERQTQLSEDVSYIQYVVEEIATRPQNVEAQQKLREKFFMREIAVLKEELLSACQAWKSMKKGCMTATSEKEGNSLGYEKINFGSEEQTRVYEKKRKRGH